MKPKKQNEALKRMAESAIAIINKLDSMKVLYGQLDELTDALVEAGANEIAVDGITLAVVDNFRAKNKLFKTTSVKRFELEILKRGAK